MSTSEWKTARRRSPLYAGLAEGFRPRRRIPLSQWAEENIVLSPERSASPGPFRIGDAVYQRGMMDAVTNPDIEELIFVTSSQVGKTSIMNAAQGYYAAEEPSPQLAVFPTQIVADAYVEEQFEPTIRDSPALNAIIDGLTYPGGYIAFVGANNPSQLAMRPIRVVTGDEVDRWPISSGKEGSPLQLAEKRQNTFRNRKKILASTPVHTKTSVIVARFKTSLMHFFHVVCPDCGHKQVLDWDNVHFEKGREEDATYHCAVCGTGWTEQMKRRLVRDAEKMGGGWIAPAKAPFKCFETKERPMPGRVGFWINALYSPWMTMAKLARIWVEAQGNPELEQTFQNTDLGLPWDGSVANFADADQLYQRREIYSPKICPKMAGAITAGVDVQDDRIEVLTVGWGLTDESWLLEHIVLREDPSIAVTWDRLAEILLRRYPHEAGKRALAIESVAIDSGGHHTQKVYSFANRHQTLGRRWFAIKGVPGEGKPLWALSKEKLKNVAKLHLIGVDDGKTLIYSRYGILKKGPGFVHIHEGFDEAALKQLTAEHALIEYDGKGFPKREWHKKQKGARNELLDCFVYATACREELQFDMVQRLQALHDVEDKELDAEAIGRLYK